VEAAAEDAAVEYAMPVEAAVEDAVPGCYSG
jgi:hypothetical protein